MKKIEIVQMCEEKDKRPQFNFEIVKYLATHIYSNFVVKNKVLAKAKYNYRIVIGFHTDVKSTTEELELLFSKARYFDFIEMKSINVNVPLNISLYDDKLDQYCYIVMFAVLAVFTEEFKSLKIDINEEVNKLMKIIDVEYIEKFEYPASLLDQKYQDDNNIDPYREELWE